MIFVCDYCNKIKEVPDPSHYDEMSIIDKLNSHRGMDHAICYDCVRKILEKPENQYEPKPNT